MAELRKNPLTREWAIITSVSTPDAEAQVACPYCSGNERLSGPELLAYRDPNTAPDTAGWRVRVVANSASCFQSEIAPERRDERIYDTMYTAGGDEIIVETPSHDQAALISDPQQSEDALWACRERYCYWSAFPSVQSVILARRHPPRAPGHPHWRLLALPVVPQPLWDLTRGMAQYYDYRGRCGVCDIVHEEAQDGNLIVAENRHFLALAPYFSAYPYEIWVVPRRHHAAITGTQRHEMQGLARILGDALASVRRALGDPCCIMTLMCAPCNIGEMEHFHWFMRLLPEAIAPTRMAVEYGISVNPIAPERAAGRLRRTAPVTLSRIRQGG